jgi:hypothetical protein
MNIGNQVKYSSLVLNDLACMSICVKKPLLRAVFSLRERKCGGFERLVD